MKTLAEKIESLSPEIQQEIEHVLDLFIVKAKKVQSAYKLQQNWAGALKDLKNKYTSLELQKKALEWWGA